jgi:hypothetical protein
VIAPGMGRDEPCADIRLAGGNSAAGIDLVYGFGEIGCRPFTIMRIAGDSTITVTRGCSSFAGIAGACV